MRVMLGLAVAAATLLSDHAKSLDLKERPVSKVINLLKEMQESMEKEKAADEALKEKMDCWCETNDKGKTAAIEEANRRIDSYHSSNQKNAAKSAQLQAEIKQAEKELAQNSEALDKATEVRDTEQNEFNQSEKDLVQSIQALKNAVLVLSKHHEAFLQTGQDTVYSRLHSGVAHQHKKRIAALIAQPNANAGSYTPASGQIFGMLKQMQEEFENNLKTSQEEEKTAQSDFASLKAAKQKEIAAGKKQIKEKTQQLADTNEALATGKEDLEMTREALASDTKFLSDLRLRCQQSDNDWALRSKTRAEEISAISETISILTDDDAHDTFSRTLNFVQKSMSKASAQAARSHASRVLSDAAQQTGSLSLLALSSGVKLDAFEKVKAAIDEMIAGLKKTQEDEVQQRDFCTDEFRQNEKQSALKQDELNDLAALIETSEATIKKLSQEIQALQDEIAEMEKQMKKASEEREAQNHEFQQAVTDQRATQDILKKALARLKVFYKEKAFLQQEPGAEVAPPPPSMGEYKQNAGAGGVMMLIQNVIDEAHEAEAEALKAESDAQAGYEDFIKNSNDSIGNANKSITAKSEEKAETDAAKVEAEGDRAAALKDAEELASYKAELHKSCDFLMNNFETRQNARQQEMDALAQAKGILSGADI